MTMLPSTNLSTQHCYGRSYGGSFSDARGIMYDNSLGSDLVYSPSMATEDESGTDRVNEEAAAASTSKDIQDHEDGWLQLSIGGHTITNQENNLQNSRKSDLVELNLLPGGGNNSSSSEQQRVLLAPRFHDVEDNFQAPPRPPPPLLPLTNMTSATTHYGYGTSFLSEQHQGTSSSFPRQEFNWIYRRPISLPGPIPIPIPIASSPSTSSRPAGGFLARSFDQLQGRSDIDFRVINPPRRSHSGVWFMLQASQNQAKEPFLPQIPKSYLRIKDGRILIRLVMKYLVNKLRLESESEVEITCRGQPILPFLTLQHVRDNIWNTRDTNVVLTLLPDSSTTDHVMVLQYGRNVQLP